MRNAKATTRKTSWVVGHRRLRRCPSTAAARMVLIPWCWCCVPLLIQQFLVAVQGFTPTWTTTSSSIVSAIRIVKPIIRTAATHHCGHLACSSRRQRIVPVSRNQQRRNSPRRPPPSCLELVLVGADQLTPEENNSSDSDTTTTKSSKGANNDDDTAARLRAVTFCHLPREQEPELLCDLLLELGACAAYLVDADRGTVQEEPLFRPIHIPDDGSSRSEEEVAQSPPTLALPVWKRCNVTAHFPASVDLAATLELVRDHWQPPQAATVPLELQVEPVPNRDWVVHVQQSWKPIVVAPCYVLRFPWHTDAQVAQAIAMASSSNNEEDGGNNNNNHKRWVQLQLQGGIAFGTGEHPTTQLCLEWLHGIVSERLRQMEDHKNIDENDTYTVLDYGAGSGILGMAACALDTSRVRAVGIDLDVDACRIANANAINNGRLPMRNYLPPLVLPKNSMDGQENIVVDYESQSLILKAHAYARNQQQDRPSTSEPANEHELILPDSVWTTQKYDCGVANILAGPLQSLAPTLAALLKPEAPLGLSGILHHQGPAVVQAYQRAGFVNVTIAQRRGDWVLVTAMRGRDDAV